MCKNRVDKNYKASKFYTTGGTILMQSLHFRRQPLLTATVGPSIFLEPLSVLSAIDVFTTSTLSDSLKTRVRNEVAASID